LRSSKPLLIGRAPDCDVAIRDIILSRHHCRIEPTESGDGWQIVDLHSKNGTQFRGHPIEKHVLRDGDELRIGRSRLTYKSGALVAAKKGAAPRKNTPSIARPVDPHEALAGTVTGMVVCEPGETEHHQGMPQPKPRPVDPGSYEADGVYDMINEIASSSWDSIQKQASEPTRMQRAMPVPGVTSANRTAPAIGPVSPPRPKPRVSFDLQASLSAEKHPDPATTPHPLQSRPLQPPSRGLRGLRWPGWEFWVVAASTLLLLLSIAGWIMLAMRVSHREPIPTTPVRFDAPRQSESTSGAAAPGINSAVGAY
jgi:pSer/pThr/pTyr-binding forkhead associated (FHA) protein